MKVVVLAGGGGTRLWPVSRDDYPKQFLKITGDLSLLQETVKRLLGLAKPNDIFIATSDRYLFHVKEQVRGLLGEAWENIVLEPMGKNTAPAMALSLRYMAEHGVNEKDTVIFCPADHIISDSVAFVGTCMRAESLASRGDIVLFGIVPDKPETGYGYIKKQECCQFKEEANSIDFYSVAEFVEKPDIKTAEKYVTSGEYFFNSGIFAMKIETFWQEISLYCPEIMNNCQNVYTEVIKKFSQMPSLSFDCAVMEKTRKASVIPFAAQWSDAGVWEAVWDLLPRSENNNFIYSGQESVFVDDSVRNCCIYNTGKTVAAIGLEDTLIVSTADAVLVAAKGHGQKVKNIVTALSKSPNKRLTLEHPTTIRPWGSFTVLEFGERYKVKKICVNPGFRLSLQRHCHRSEHWVVVRGTAKVTVEDREIYLRENESVYVQAMAKHRLENPGKFVLEMIEVQTGAYLEEDDIERFDDDYKRNS